jgi:hypothetical protein
LQLPLGLSGGDILQEINKTFDFFLNVAFNTPNASETKPQQTRQPRRGQSGMGQYP